MCSNKHNYRNIYHNICFYMHYGILDLNVSEKNGLFYCPPIMAVSHWPALCAEDCEIYQKFGKGFIIVHLIYFPRAVCGIERDLKRNPLCEMERVAERRESKIS